MRAEARSAPIGTPFQTNFLRHISVLSVFDVAPTGAPIYTGGRIDAAFYRNQGGRMLANDDLDQRDHFQARAALE
jgi:hypothetical protein